MLRERFLFLALKREKVILKAAPVLNFQKRNRHARESHSFHAVVKK